MYLRYFPINFNLIREAPYSPCDTFLFISSFNCLYQRDHNVIPAAETIPSKCIKSCQNVQKHPETVQVAVVPTESISFISL